MFQHPSLTYDIPHAFRPHHLLLADIFEGERQARVLALHDADLPKRTLADNSQQAEVVEVNLVGEDNGLAIGVAHLRGWRVKAKCAVRTGKIPRKADLGLLL